jgi:hypothetical protein
LVLIIVSIVGLKLDASESIHTTTATSCIPISRLQILSQHVTQSNSAAVTGNLHTHFSGWTTAVRQSIENFYEGLLVSVAHDIGRIVGAFKFT